VAGGKLLVETTRGARGAVTLSVSEALAMTPAESFTVTICVNVPACEGVPESSPVGLNVKLSTPVPDHV
jgi:hypothetical protein